MATPRRLVEFTRRKKTDFVGLKFVVVDDADVVLNLGFGKELEQLRKTPSFPKPSSRHETLLVTGVVNTDVKALAAGEIFFHSWVLLR